jgi:Holliday junction resolvase RusA-like endonuclease
MTKRLPNRFLVKFTANSMVNKIEDKDFISQKEWQQMSQQERDVILNRGVAAKLGRIVQQQIQKLVNQPTEVKAPPLCPNDWPARSVHMTLAVPVSVNAAYADIITTNQQGKQCAARVLTEAGREFKNITRRAARAYASLIKFAALPGDRFALHIELYFADMRRDISDAIKLLEDAVAEGIGFNDNRVDEMHVYRRPVCPDNPRVEVTLEKFES